MNQSLRVCGQDLRIEGGMLRMVRVDGEKYCFLDDPPAIIEGLRNSEAPADIFTFMQRLPDTTPKYTYPMEWDNFAALPITTFDHWWNKQIGFKARNKAKQAAKRGVVLKEVHLDDALLEGIWKIYNESPVRQGKKFPHYGMGLEKLRSYAGTFPGQSVFIGAFVEEELIGFVKLTIDKSGMQAGLMHIVSLLAHRDKAPTNALIAQAVKSCAERKIPFLVYSNFAYGRKQRDSLSDFKERNGFERMNVPRYYIPLSAKGALALRLGLHRRLVDYVPESMMEKLREFRTSWYSRKLQSSTEAT